MKEINNTNEQTRNEESQSSYFSQSPNLESEIKYKMKSIKESNEIEFSVEIRVMNRSGNLLQRLIFKDFRRYNFP